jgi:nucleoside-diphosphate-sugar epimerase
MRPTIFLAGASGAIGRRLAPMLIERGWLVFGTTRKPDRMKAMQDSGVEPLLVDVFDRDLLTQLMRDIRPDIVMHQLTDLPYALDAGQMAAALVRNARIRNEGTRHLVAAATAAGCRRIIAQSLAFIYDEGPKPHTESDPLLPDTHPAYGATAAAVRSLEHQVLGSACAGVVLRYGLFYGPGTGFEQPIAPGSVHVDAAALAAVLAVTAGRPGIYNIAEDDGLVSIAKAQRDLTWDPAWRSSL